MAEDENEERNQRLLALKEKPTGLTTLAGGATAPGLPLCEALTRRGQPCRRAARDGERYCTIHKSIQARMENAPKPATKGDARDYWEKMIGAPIVMVKTYDDAMAVLSGTLNLLFQDKIDGKKALAVVNICQAMLRALHESGGESKSAKLRIKLGIGKDGSQEKVLEFEGVSASDVAAYRKALE